MRSPKASLYRAERLARHHGSRRRQRIRASWYAWSRAPIRAGAERDSLRAGWSYLVNNEAEPNSVPSVGSVTVA